MKRRLLRCASSSSILIFLLILFFFHIGFSQENLLGLWKDHTKTMDDLRIEFKAELDKHLEKLSWVTRGIIELGLKDLNIKQEMRLKDIWQEFLAAETPGKSETETRKIRLECFRKKIQAEDDYWKEIKDNFEKAQKDPDYKSMIKESLIHEFNENYQAYRNLSNRFRQNAVAVEKDIAEQEAQASSEALKKEDPQSKVKAAEKKPYMTPSMARFFAKKKPLTEEELEEMDRAFAPRKDREGKKASDLGELISSEVIPQHPEAIYTDGEITFTVWGYFSKGLKKRDISKDMRWLVMQQGKEPVRLDGPVFKAKDFGPGTFWVVGIYGTHIVEVKVSVK